MGWRLNREAQSLVVRKLSFLVFLILRMDFGIVGVEFGSGGLDRKLSVDFDPLEAALVEQRQHFRAQLLN